MNDTTKQVDGDLLSALRLAEAALADIGDADREPGDDLAWCERRAAQALPKVRSAIKSAPNPSKVDGEAISDAAVACFDGGYFADASRPSHDAWVRKCLAAALPHLSPLQSRAELSDGYVQTVPDKCDRITWRNRYYQLPVSSSSAPLPPQGAAVEPEKYEMRLLHGYGLGWGEWATCSREVHKQNERERLNIVQSRALYAAPQPAATAWTCFHCDETFTDRDAASLHFGTHMHQQPGCTIDLSAYREMEALQARYVDEDAAVHRTMRRMDSNHAQDVRRAEEAGYAKGVKDAEAEAAAPAQVAGSDVTDARTILNRAKANLPTKVETSRLGDMGPEEQAAFDSGYNAALDRAHALLNLPASETRAAGSGDEFAEQDRETGRKWREDSSLEKWFPITAEELDRLRHDLAAAKQSPPAAMNEPFGNSERLAGVVVPDAAALACALAEIDGYDPRDQNGGLYDLRWSGGPNPEPAGDAWHMDYLPKAERICQILAAQPAPSAGEQA